MSPRSSRSRRASSRCRGGSGIEHRPAAERGLAAQDHPVASCGDHGRRESKLGEALAEPYDARERVRRPDVHLHSCAVVDRLELLERDVEPVGDRIGARRDERLASRNLVALHPGKAHRNPLTRLGTIDVMVVHLHAPNPDVAAGRARAAAGRRPRSCPTRASRSPPCRSPGRRTTRSTYSRVGPSDRACSTASAARPSAARRSSRPSPVRALTRTTSRRARARAPPQRRARPHPRRRRRPS